MKKTTFVLSFLISLACAAQDTIKTKGENQAISENSKDIPFIIIEDVPIFPGCENQQMEDRKGCMSKNLKKHIARKFNASVVDTLGLLQGNYKVNVTFRINKLGLLDRISAVGPHLNIENEAIRVIKMLPQFVPGKYKGENVAVTYMMPINFYVGKPKGKRKRKNKN